MNPDDIEDAFPLSPTQQGMLFHMLANPESDVYTSYVTARLTGQLDVQRLKQAWQKTLQNHELLRASFLWEGLDEPVQVIHRTVDLTWRTESTSELSDSEHVKAVSDAIRQERTQSLDLSCAPLMRLTLIQSQPNQSTLIWTVHHLLADGWSTPLILGDVMRLYHASLSEPDVSSTTALPYREFIEWHKTKDQNSLLDYWRPRLASSTPVTINLPPKNSAVHQQSDDLIPHKTLLFNEEQTQHIEAFCRTHSVTLGTLMHSVWSLLLRDYTNAENPLFGSTVSGRPPELPAVEQSVGLFLTTLPLSIDITPDENIPQWLKRTQTTMQNDARHGAILLSELQKHLTGKVAGQDLFESIVVVESHSSDMAFGSLDSGLVMDDIEYITHSHYPLALLVIPGNSLELKLVFDIECYHSTHIESMLHYFQQLLDVILSDPQLRPIDVSRVSAERNKRVLANLGNQPIHNAHVSLHNWFETTVAASPDAIALVGDKGTVSRGALNSWSNAIARQIRERQNLQGGIVGILMERSDAQIAALLGVLKSGNAYLPLDTSLPPLAINRVLQQANVQLVLRDNSGRIEQDLIEADFLVVEDAEHYPTTTLSEFNQQDHRDSLAYVIFTSGSSGTPKGVPVTHSNVIYSTQARLDYYRAENPRFLLLSALSFDSSVAGIFWMLCGGGTLVLPNAGDEKDPDALLSLISEHRITHTLCLPTLYHSLLTLGDRSTLDSLQCVIVAGEACSPTIVSTHHELIPDVLLVNEYGPTEATVWSTVKTLTIEDHSPVPIGKPIGNSLVLILNSNGQVCPNGIEGEIYIGGKGVACGYLTQPDLTSERFVKNPFYMQEYPVLYRTGDSGYRSIEGDIVFTGRIDRQLKIRGHRIEPQQIESVLLENAGISDAVVIGWQPIETSSSPSISTTTHETTLIDRLSDALELLPDSVALQLLQKLENSGDRGDSINIRTEQ